MWYNIIQALGIIATIAGGVMGWQMTQIYKKFDEQKIDIKANVDRTNAIEIRLEAHRLYAAETFATKLDVEKGFDRVMNKLESIDTKLDQKVDK